MLLEFTVENYLSFKESATLSMVAATPYKELADSHVFSFSYPDSRLKPVRLLKSAVVYGANASGKSNLIQAFSFMKKMVLDYSITSRPRQKIPVKPFAFSTETENKTSIFEIIFIHDNRRFRYGFELDKEKIYAEWLFSAQKGPESRLFVREGETITIGSRFKEGRSLDRKTRENALFLAVVGQFNGELSLKVMDWFGEFTIISGLHDEHYKPYSVMRVSKDNEFKEEVLKLFKIADVGIENLTIAEGDIAVQDSPEESLKIFFKEAQGKKEAGVETNHPAWKQIELVSMHSRFGPDGARVAPAIVDFSNESQGTRQLLALAGPFLDALDNGNILVVDELDARFHPMLTRMLIGMFHSSEINRKNAQLIFATHDTSQLDRDIFRRDQIWFTEKNLEGATTLYPLSDYKVRKDASFEKDYIQGKYGAVPFVGSLDRILEARG